MKNKKNIICDWDGVLINIPSVNGYSHYFHAAEKVAKDLGLSFLTAEAIEKYWNKNRHLKKYEMSIDVLVLEFGADYQEAHRLIHEYLLKDFLDIYEINHELVEQIKVNSQHDYYVATHANSVWLEYWLEQTGLTDVFKNVFYVKQHGLCKYSHNETYKKALEHFGIAAESTIMLEDSERNLPLAVAEGIEPRLFSRTQSTLGYPTFDCPIKLVASF